MSEIQAVTVLTISGALVFGVVLALLGSIKQDLARRFDLGGRRVAGLLASFNLALIPMTLLCGYLVDRWSEPTVLMLGSVLTAGAIFAMSRAPSYRGAVGAVLMIGFGAAAVSTATIKLMPLSFFAVHHAARALCLGHVFIALGALVTPALADVLVHRLDFRRAIAILALLCLVPAFLCVLPPFFEAAATLTRGKSSGTLFEPDKLWQLLLAGMVFFFYAPLEGSITIWTTTFLTDRGHGARSAAWLLTCFWLALGASRLLVALIPFTDRWYPWLIVLPALLAVVCLFNLAASGDKSAPVTGLLLVGFLLGPIFPTLIAVLSNVFHQDLGLAYGCVFAIGSLGGLTLAPLVTTRTGDGSVKTPFGVPLALALVLTTAALVFALTVGRGMG